MAAKLANGLTIKQDGFCHGFVANGGNASEAYRAVYDTNGASTTENRDAHELVKNPKIAARITELQDQAIEYAGISPQSIAAEFTENRRKAAEWEQSSGMNTATERKADLLDLFGKRKLDIRKLTVSAELDMTVEELRELVGGLEMKALGDGKE